jgi:hypothetical protein
MSNDTQGLNASEMMDLFIDKLVIEAGMDKDLEESTVVGLKKDLKERLENRIKAMILSQIPEDKLNDFEKIIDSGDATSTQNFCNENIANFPELLAGELLNFRSRYIA